MKALFKSIHDTTYIFTADAPQMIDTLDLSIADSKFYANFLLHLVQVQADKKKQLLY